MAAAIARFRRFPARALTRSGLAVSGPFVAYAFCPPRKVVHCDSGGKGRGFGDPSPQELKIEESKEGEPNDAEEESHPWFGDDDGHAWASFSQKLADAGHAISALEWSTVGDRIADYVTPRWAKTLPGYIRKLQQELSQDTGSLAEEIMDESRDSAINPEIRWPATVRISQALCDEERAFQARRRRHTRRALARYLGLAEADVHPADVPTIAMCGSGGGLRALIAGASSYLSTQEAGLLDCVTYTAGVSGSCWQQALYHSTLAKQNYQRLIDHLKKRLGVHIAFPPAALQLLTSAPTNKFLLSGLVEKSKNDPDADFGLVDIYGLLLAARLLVPRGELEVEPRDLKLSDQRAHLRDGENPMPIYTAVRHEIPEAKNDDSKEPGNKKTKSEELKKKAKEEAWFQWFEWSPYEFWSEEIGAGVPTYALGRHFDNGTSTPLESGLQTPELCVSNLLGIWGSAFCATLSHYYHEIRPVVKGIAGFAGVDELIKERNEDLARVHPIDPGCIPNYARGLAGQLPATCPPSLLSDTHLQLMDAGMSNNLPIYPLLRPGRDVDIIIAFDASADVKEDNWLKVADGYARQRGIRGWPVGIGWPPAGESPADSARRIEAGRAESPDEARKKLARARDEAEAAKEDAGADGGSLGYCTVWIGSAEERSAPAHGPLPPSKRFAPDDDWAQVASGAADASGLAVVYFPLLPNPAVPGLDPQTTDFLSTWNFIYTPQQIEQVVALARANFDAGAEQTRRCVRAVYERKKRARLEREENEERAWRKRSDEETDSRWKKRLKKDAKHFS